MKKYLAEFIGTCIFCLAFVFLYFQGNLILTSICLGVIYGALIVLFRKYAPSHFNPLFTLVNGMIDPEIEPRIPKLIFAQALGGIAAGGIALLFFDHTHAEGLFWSKKLIVAEFLMSYMILLLFCVLLNEKYGKEKLRLGLIGPVYSCVFAVFRGFTLAVANPALVLALAILGIIQWADIWIYLTAQISAVVLSYKTAKMIMGYQYDFRNLD